DVHAVSTSGEKLAMIKDLNDAPRWNCTDTSKKISRIEYKIDLHKMERQILPGDASIIRSGFAGILNYSIFWMDRRNRKTKCAMHNRDIRSMAHLHHKQSFFFNDKRFTEIYDRQLLSVG